MKVITHTLSDELPPQWRHQKKKKRSIPRHITERRKEVLHWMAKGKDNLEIAQILGINFYTAKNHVCHILRVYNTSNRISAVLRAIARGDIRLDDVVKDFA